MLTKLIHCQIWILENILTKILHSNFRILRKMLIISHSKFQYCKMCMIICKFKSSATTTDRAGIEGWTLCTDIFSLIKPGCVKMEKKSGAITHRENTVWSVFIFFFLSCPDLLLVACLFSSLLICLPYCLMKPWLFSSAIFFSFSRMNISFSLPQLRVVISVTPGDVRCHPRADCSAMHNRSVWTGIFSDEGCEAITSCSSFLSSSSVRSSNVLHRDQKLTRSTLDPNWRHVHGCKWHLEVKVFGSFFVCPNMRNVTGRS